jgi:hypothetical protein
MRIFPEKYEELDIDKYDKQLLATVKKVYREDEVATFMLCCNPTKTKEGVVDILITATGVLCVKIIRDITQEELLPYLFERQLQQKTEMQLIYERMKLQKVLMDGNELKYSVKVITLFPSCEKPQLIDNPAMKEFNKFVEMECYFSDFFSNAMRDQRLLDRGMEYFRKSKITNEVLPDIVNRLTPEYTIPQKKAAITSTKVSVKTKLVDQKVSEADRAALAYLLDDNQINYINKIKKGDQLIMACAGSGKSVILLSKCFKVASLNPDKKFLVTGYNRNLVSYFKWLIDSAGFSSENVECLTFHKLAVTLLKKNGLQIPLISQNDYTAVVEKLKNSITQGKIKDKYFGIFIDEVQMFEPDWYKICYQLLENRESDEHFFVICGDKSQSVKKSIKSGKAPWQGHGDEYPSFRGKSFPIEINYRNSIQINNYIRNFTDYALRYSEIFNIQMNQDADIFLRGKAIRDGLDLRLVHVKHQSSAAEAIAVLNQVIDIHDNYKIPYDSIAVIYFNKQYRWMKNWEDQHYEPIEHLREMFKVANIPDCMLVNTQDEYATSYANISGVPIVSMESSLGLDFKAVVLCGLRPLGLHDGTKNIQTLMSNKKSPNQDVADAFCKNINIVYMSCARAKDILRVVLTEGEDESFYAKLLIKSFEEE